MNINRNADYVAEEGILWDKRRIPMKTFKCLVGSHVMMGEKLLLQTKTAYPAFIVPAIALNTKRKKTKRNNKTKKTQSSLHLCGLWFCNFFLKEIKIFLYLPLFYSQSPWGSKQNSPMSHINHLQLPHRHTWHPSTLTTVLPPLKQFAPSLV